jgi:hypothetical protein
MRRLVATVCSVAAFLSSPGCREGSNPVVPTNAAPVPPPPAAVAAATPSPPPALPTAPTPTPCPGECPVINTNPTARLTIRLYAVVDGNGTLQTGLTEASAIPVGFKLTLDLVPKDADENETLGQGQAEFHFSDEALVRVGSNHGYQRKLTVLRPGRLEASATLDGVDSNVLALKFVR